MKNISILIKLANLKPEECGHTRFDFSTYRKDIDGGTAGCLAGELPFIDPENWEFEKEIQEIQGYNLVYKPDPTCTGISGMMAYFDMSQKEVLSVFGWATLKATSTLEEVQANLKKFLKEKSLLVSEE